MRFKTLLPFLKHVSRRYESQAKYPACHDSKMVYTKTIKVILFLLLTLLINPLPDFPLLPTSFPTTFHSKGFVSIKQAASLLLPAFFSPTSAPNFWLCQLSGWFLGPTLPTCLRCPPFFPFPPSFLSSMFYHWCRGGTFKAPSHPYLHRRQPYPNPSRRQYYRLQRHQLRPQSCTPRDRHRTQL